MYVCMYLNLTSAVNSRLVSTADALESNDFSIFQGIHSLDRSRAFLLRGSTKLLRDSNQQHSHGI